MNERLRHRRAGEVPIWLDPLSRDMLDSRGIGTLTNEYARSGATTKPMIFANAIIGSDRYAAQLRRLTAVGARHPQELLFSPAARRHLRRRGAAATERSDRNAGEGRVIELRTLIDL